MKTLMTTFALALVIASASAQQITAASKTNTTSEIKKENLNKYVVLTKELRQLPAILMAGEELAQADPEHFSDFQVVLYGEAVKIAEDPEKLVELIKYTERIKGSVYICEYAAKQMGVDLEKASELVKVVENAFRYVLHLQDEGYSSLSL